MEKCLVLLSGGLDSATCLAYAVKQGFKPYALSFDYGQRHKVELEKAKLLAMKYNAVHFVFPLDLRVIGGSALTDDNLDIPDTPLEKIGKEGIPITYVPARNSIFLSIAAGFCEINRIEHIFIGVNALDYSGYPDCRPEFIKAMQKALTLGTKYGDEGKAFQIHTPLLNLKKSEIIKLGMELGVDYSLTNSCYNPDSEGNPCGKCDSCKLRLAGFKEAGFKDPLNYPEGTEL